MQRIKRCNEESVNVDSERKRARVEDINVHLVVCIPISRKQNTDDVLSAIAPKEQGCREACQCVSIAFGVNSYDSDMTEWVSDCMSMDHIENGDFESVTIWECKYRTEKFPYAAVRDKLHATSLQHLTNATHILMMDEDVERLDNNYWRKMIKEIRAYSDYDFICGGYMLSPYKCRGKCKPSTTSDSGNEDEKKCGRYNYALASVITQYEHTLLLPGCDPNTDTLLCPRYFTETNTVLRVYGEGSGRFVAKCAIYKQQYDFDSYREDQKMKLVDGEPIINYAVWWDILSKFKTDERLTARTIQWRYYDNVVFTGELCFCPIGDHDIHLVGTLSRKCTVNNSKSNDELNIDNVTYLQSIPYTSQRFLQKQPYMSEKTTILPWMKYSKLNIWVHKPNNNERIRNPCNGNCQKEELKQKSDRVERELLEQLKVGLSWSETDLRWN